MFRQAVTAREIATLYGMSALDFGEGRSYLVDTEEGRRFLLKVARDMWERISDRNSPHTSPEAFDEWLDESLSEGLMDETDTKIDLLDGLMDEILPSTSFRGGRPQPSIDEMFVLADRLDEMKSAKAQEVIGRKLESLHDQVSWLESNGDVHDALDGLRQKIGNAERMKSVHGSGLVRSSLEDLVEEDGGREGIESAEREGELWNGFENLVMSDSLDDDVGKGLLEDWERDHNASRYEDSWRESEDVHFGIDDLVRSLGEMIERASSPDADRDDLLGLMGVVDEVMGAAHHGGPLLQYAVETDEFGRERDPIYEQTEGDATGPSSWPPSSMIEGEVHMKGGSRYPGLVRSLGLLPPDAERFLGEQMGLREQEAYQSSLESGPRGYAGEHAREDYYRHPRFTSPETWRRENVPGHAQWEVGDPRAVAMENARLVGEDNRRRQEMREADPWGNGNFMTGDRERMDETRRWHDWFSRGGWRIDPSLVRGASMMDRAGFHRHADMVDRGWLRVGSQLGMFEEVPVHGLVREDGSPMGVPDSSVVRRMRFTLDARMRELSSVVPLHEQQRLLFEATGKSRVGLMDERDCGVAFGVLRRFEDVGGDDGGLLACSCGRVVVASVGECPHCGSEAFSVPSCIKTLEGQEVFGEHEMDELAPRECHDCGVVKGGFHHDGCDMDHCPGPGCDGEQMIIEHDCDRKGIEWESDRKVTAMLARLASRLDGMGMHREADELDRMML